MERKPDIVFLILDTQRVDRLSCYGYHHQTSPHLDDFAADATLFRYGISPAQWTVPTHASMFTGLYPSEHTTQQSYSVLPDELPTLADRLYDGGYYTAAFCNNPLVGVVHNGLRRGFYSFLNYSGLLTNRPNQAGKPKTPFGRYRQFFKRMVSGILHRMQDAFARSDALLAFAFTPLMVPFWQTALSFKGNTGRSLADAARLLIERKGLDEGQPAFCFINLMGTHMPFHPNHEQLERFAPKVLHSKESRRFLQKLNGDVFGWLAPLASSMAGEHKAIIDGVYDAEVATQDEHLGTFFKQLRESGAIDNTLIVVCADHGEHLGEKHLMGHTVSLYNVLTHVPLIIRDPSGILPKGSTVEQTVSTRRLFHTALTAAGLAEEHEKRYTLLKNLSGETSDESAGNLDANLNNNLNEDLDPDGGVVFAEAVTPQNVLNLMKKHKPELVEKHATDQGRQAVWSYPYKLIVTGNGRRELYNYADDPTEQVDLSEELPEISNKLYEHLQTFKLRVDAMPSLSSRTVVQDDPQLKQRLRALGYLE
ncbi:MAG: sulfatase [Chloroflexota bacterium]